MAQLSLPSDWDADNIPGHDSSLDECFAQVLGQLMTGLLSPEESVLEWSRACDREARRIHHLSHDFDYSSRARYEEEVQELRDERDTWSLIAHMFSRYRSLRPDQVPVSFKILSITPVFWGGGLCTLLNTWRPLQ